MVWVLVRSNATTYILDDGVYDLFQTPCMPSNLEADNISWSNLYHRVSDGTVQNSFMATISSEYVRGSWPECCFPSTARPILVRHRSDANADRLELGCAAGCTVYYRSGYICRAHT